MSKLLDRVKPNILIAMSLIAGLGGVITYFGFKMSNEGLMSAAGVGSIVAISNLAGKILEKE
jgi:uncharacterized membrane protein (UPF0136 family)